MTCPLQCAARGNFWGGANDTDVHDLQTPTATQTSFDETHTTSASVSTTANTSEKRKIKNIEFVGNNVIDKSLILQQMKLQAHTTENLCNVILKLSTKWDILQKTCVQFL